MPQLPRPYRSAFVRIALAGLSLAPLQAVAAAVDAGLADSVAIQGDEAEELLVGIYYNKALLEESIIYRSRGEYWIAFEPFLKRTGLREAGRLGTVASYPTDLGTLSFDTAALRTFETERCISFSDLKRSFLAAPSFDPSLYAVLLDIPWRAGEGVRKKEEPDVRAPSGTVSYIGMEARTEFDFRGAASKNLLLESSGRGLDGVWSVTASGDPEERMTPSRYNWTTFSRNTALRLGTGYSGSHSLVGSSYMTGVQFGWNNRSIVRRLDAEQGFGSDTFLSFDMSQMRTLEGAAPPGGIAELRFDGEVVARQRIRLDGTFSFSGVRMDSDLRKTEVYIYERSINENPLRIIDFSLTAGSRSLPEGELMLRGGLGRTGNILDGEDGAGRSTEAFTDILWGLDRRVTLEAGYQENASNGTADLLAGTVLSIGKSWTAALYAARSNSRYGSDMRLEGRYRHWDLSYWGTLHEEGYGDGLQPEEESHSVRWGVRPTEGVYLQAIGRRQVSADSLECSYLLPAAVLSPYSWWRLSAIPHDDRTYRYETGFRLGRADRVNGILDLGVLSLDYRHDLSRELNLRLVNDYAFSTADAVTNLGFDWYPAGGSRQNLSTMLSYSGGAFGVSGSFSRYLNTGLRVSMQYSFNMNNAANLSTTPLVPIDGGAESRNILAMTLSWDLGWSQRGFVPINRNEVTLTRGALAGRLEVDDGAGISTSEMNDIRILLNGRSLQQRQINGDFFLGRLRPGVYRVSVDRENLPIELVSTEQEITVEIKNGAVTGMKIPLYAEYGAAGRVTGSDGEGVADALVSIRSEEGALVAAATTNRFGYYRVDGLRRGLYRASTEGAEDLPFRIEDDYLFELDLKRQAP